MNRSTMTDVALAMEILVVGLAAITLNLHGVLPARCLAIETIHAVVGMKSARMPPCQRKQRPPSNCAGRGMNLNLCLEIAGDVR